MINTAKTKVYSALEVANICGVVNQTVINWIKKGYLESFSTPGSQYRVYQDDLIEFMKGRKMRIPEELLNGEGENGKKDLKVLVIEDERGLNQVLARYLEREFPGHEVFQSFDSFEAGAKLAEKIADVVLLDLDIDGVVGIDLCRKIRTADEFGKPKVVVIAQNDCDIEGKDFASMKISGFCKKPLNLDELRKVFAKLLK